MKFKIERLGGTHMIQHVAETCSNCTGEVKSRKREFSEQAWSVLVLWSEVQKAAVDQPICEDCYNELREVLIDRSAEIEIALRDAHTKKPAAAAATRTDQPRRPVRKAG